MPGVAVGTPGVPSTTTHGHVRAPGPIAKSRLRGSCSPRAFSEFKVRCLLQDPRRPGDRRVRVKCSRSGTLASGPNGALTFGNGARGGATPANTR